MRTERPAPISRPRYACQDRIKGRIDRYETEVGSNISFNLSARHAVEWALDLNITLILGTITEGSTWRLEKRKCCHFFSEDTHAGQDLRAYIRGNPGICPDSPSIRHLSSFRQHTARQSLTEFAILTSPSTTPCSMIAHFLLKMEADSFNTQFRE